MARIWSSGFELNSTTNIEAIDYHAGGTGTVLDIVTSPVRSGTYALHYKSGTAGAVVAWYEYSFPAMSAGSVYYYRIYFRYATLPDVSTECPLQLTNSAATKGAQIAFTTSGTLQLQKFSNDAQLGSDSPALSANTWYRIEVAYDYTAATATAYLNGTQFATGTADATAAISLMELGSDGPFNNTTTGEWYFDDIAINDATGSYQNSLPGDGKIVHFRPNGAGDTNTAASGDYTDLDEVTPDDATTIVTLATAFNQIAVALQNSSDVGIGASDTVKLVQVGARFSAGSGGGNNSSQVYVKSQASGTVVYGTQLVNSNTTYFTNAPPSPTNYRLTQYVDPQAGGSWTPALLDTSQIGFIGNDNDPDNLLSTLWALVEYVPSAGGTPATTANSGFFTVV